jgi:hypothetical protein
LSQACLFVYNVVYKKNENIRNVDIENQNKIQLQYYHNNLDEMHKMWKG